MHVHVSTPGTVRNVSTSRSAVPSPLNIEPRLEITHAGMIPDFLGLFYIWRWHTTGTKYSSMFRKGNVDLMPA